MKKKSLFVLLLSLHLLGCNNITTKQTEVDKTVDTSNVLIMLEAEKKNKEEEQMYLS